MEINVTELENCKLAIQYTADSEEILNKRAEVLKVFKDAPVPGFRKGKATVDAIKMHYRNQIDESLKRALAEDAYHNTIFEKKYRPYGSPMFHSALLEGGKFICKFDLLVKPEFELSEYKGFEIPKLHEEYDNETVVQKMLQDLRVRFGTATPYTESDFIQMTDNVILNYQGFIGDVKVDSLCAEGDMLTVGQSQLPNFDNSLIGMKIGEEREFDILIPNTGLPSFAGKTVHFKASLVMGSKNVPCPLDDELAAKTGKKDFAELKEFVGQIAMSRISESRRLKLIESIANRLLEKHSFEIPQWLTLVEAKYLAQVAKLDWDKLSDEDRSMYLVLGEKNVRLSLVLDSIRDKEIEAQISDQEVFEIVKQNIAKTQPGTDPSEMLQKMSQTGYLQVLFARIRDEHTLSFLLGTIKVIE
jgi:trigger factor